MMPVTAQWLPVEDSFELQLFERPMRDDGSFVKRLRYNMPPRALLTSAVLTDVGEAPVGLFVARSGPGDERPGNRLEGLVVDAALAWIWQTAAGAMPTLPPKHRAPATA